MRDVPGGVMIVAVSHNDRGGMNFVDATTVLTSGPTLGDLADDLGVSAVSLSRARTARSNRFYRSPPDGWEESVMRLAREQSEALDALVARLSAPARGARRSGRKRKRARRR
ncbi:MAG: hypothetical protein L0271_12195 [Gemmatimonadetes bacterium]|nr:hypothetical protein [Gemmatimonadota bacterium]